MSQTTTAKIYSNGRGQMADPEVEPKASRRKFSVAYKVSILEQAEQCNEPGEVGAMLRREGLYSSHLSKWRQQQQAGQLEQPHKRGRKSNPQATELARLQQENERLKAKLERAELIIEAQKKLCQLLNLPLYEVEKAGQK
jgi:transposase-like protein